MVEATRFVLGQMLPMTCRSLLKTFVYLAFVVISSPHLQAEPLPKELSKPTFDLSNTIWEGDGVVAPTTYTFEKNGVMVYAYNGKSHRTGTWKQEKNSIYWECNNRYCEFKGTFTQKTMQGDAWNVTGGQWKLKMTFVRKLP